MRVVRGALAAGLLAGLLGLGLAGCDGGLLQEPDSGKLPPLVRLEAVSGDDQAGPVGQALPAPLRVRIIDVEGGPLSRVRVEWTAGPGAGSAEPRNSFTDADGVAEATWTLGPAAGPQELSAGLGAAEPVVFRATGTP